MAKSYETGPHERARLMKFNIEKIEQGYLQAIQAGEGRPVMHIIDLRDKMGFELASRLDPENVKKVRDECNERDVIPTAIPATEPTAADDRRRGRDWGPGGWAKRRGREGK